eukprot:scaffold93872_cov65-Attheya_sp.AAC.2
MPEGDVQYCRGAWAIEITLEHATGQRGLLLHSGTGSAIVEAIVGEPRPSIFLCVYQTNGMLRARTIIFISFFVKEFLL